MGNFSLDVRRWVEKTRADVRKVTQAVAVELHARIVMRSPVGNPELWAANAEAALQRSQHNAVVDQVNANLASDPRNLTAKGNLKRRVRSASNKRLSRAQLAKTYPLASGQGYVGGRFRGNWLVSIGSPAQGTVQRVDPSGNETIEDGGATIATFENGETIFIVNNLPYAQRLEYGWSKQAPAGCVRVTVAEFQSIVDEQVAAVRGGST